MKIFRFGVSRLFILEVKKLLKGKALYIVLAVMALFAVMSTSSQADNYSRELSGLNREMNQTLSSLENGGLNLTYLPAGFDRSERPLRDANFAIIQENVEFYRPIYTDYFQSRIDGLTVKGGKYSLGGMMGNGASETAMLLPLLAMALAVGLFAGEHRGGYRIMVSRGVKRSKLMSAKLLTTLGLSVALATVFTIALLLSSLMADSSIGGAGLAGLSSSTLLGIFGVALLMFTAYMLVGGVVGTVLSSSSSAMAVGLALAFISVVFFFALTPEDDFFLAALSPVSLGYNFNSLMYYIWRAGEEADRYRPVVASLAFIGIYAGIYISLIYSVFSNKELKG